MPACNNHKGFSLVELSIVLVIIGIVMTAALKLAGPISQIVKMRETKERMDSALQSVVGYAATHNAVMSNLSSVAVPRSSWGKNFAYLHDTRFSLGPTKDTICGRSSTSLRVHTREPDVTTGNVVFAIISSTEDLDFKSDLDAVVITGSFPINGAPGVLKTVNIDAQNKDLVRFVTLEELRTKIGCQGTPLKIVNNELPYGNYSAKYSATVIADGGSGSSNYQWRIEGSFPKGITSPALPFKNNSSVTEWTTATSVNILGYPQPSGQGNYPFTILVRDAADAGSSSSKPFVLTVYPRPN